VSLRATTSRTRCAAQWRHWGRIASSDTIQGVTPESKEIVAEFTKNTGQNYVGRWELRSCDETTAKKGHHFVAMTKIGRQFF